MSTHIIRVHVGYTLDWHYFEIVQVVVQKVATAAAKDAAGAACSVCSNGSWCC